ncbi:MAG: hypothetical protein AAFR61_19305 [Bacteroidota bacterium]
MNNYQDWNFKDNPFKTTSLPAEDEGNNLIAGREQEIRKLIRRIYNQPQIPTIEGLNGIGKTSIINVSIFRAFQHHLKEKNSPIFIPCIRSFQLKEDISADDFLDEVLIEIAQTFIKYQRDLNILNVRLPDNLEEIDKWLNSPFTKSYQGSLGTPLLSLGGGQTIEANTSRGFEKSGFRRAVRNWLINMFPKENSGGVVCVIDNLELLEKSQNARKIIEDLRDNLFNIQGIRWIMCGSLGIVSSIVSSPRLEGLMHDPLQIGGIQKIHLGEVFERRVKTYRRNQEYYLPITKQSFGLLYDVLKSNIRNTLKYANDFCVWIDDMGLKPSTIDAKEMAFMDWLTKKSNKYLVDVKTQIKPRTLKLFKDAIEIDGIFAMGDFQLFEYQSAQKMRSCIRSLESVGLVVSVIDENDHRRKSIQITPKGWFVSHAL